MGRAPRRLQDPGGESAQRAEVCADPQLEGRGIITEVPAPDGSGATLKLPAAAFIANADGPKVPGPAPKLGADTNDVLLSLGYSADEIAKLEIT